MDNNRFYRENFNLYLFICHFHWIPGKNAKRMLDESKNRKWHEPNIQRYIITKITDCVTLPKNKHTTNHSGITFSICNIIPKKSNVPKKEFASEKREYKSK